jgi:hypothetical protein
VIFDQNKDDRDAYVTVETVHADLEVRASEDVDVYRRRWSLLQQMAIFDDEARWFLSQLANDIRSHAE